MVGYLMILMNLVDTIYIIIPAQLQNPQWELNTLTTLSNHSWSFLIGTGFVITSFFSDHISRVRLIEVYFLMAIRWGLLLLAFFYLLSLPLVLANTSRLISLIKTNVSQELQTRTQLTEQVQKNLDTFTNPNQLLQIAQSLGLPLSSSTAPPTQIKQEIQQQLPLLKTRLAKEASKSESQQIQELLKRSSRTAIQLIIISVANFLVWLKTRNINTLLL
jgi:hypothetical protein